MHLYFIDIISYFFLKKVKSIIFVLILRFTFWLTFHDPTRKLEFNYITNTY